MTKSQTNILIFPDLSILEDIQYLLGGSHKYEAIQLSE